MKQLLFIVFIFFNFISLGQSNIALEKGLEEVEMKTLIDTFYSIQYPSDWELDQSGLKRTKFIILAPIENDNDNFRENINLLSQNLRDKNISFEKYITLTEKSIVR